jgi:hypothetical protein
MTVCSASAADLRLLDLQTDGGCGDDDGDDDDL